VDEAIAIASGAGCPLEISHLKAQGPRNWDKLDQIFARIAEAKLRIDVAFDRYPYVAYQTTLANLFPAASRDGGTGAFLARLTDSATATQLREDALAKVESLGGWDHVMISSVADSSDRSAEGQRMGEYAKARGEDPYALTVALLNRSGGDVGMVGFAMSEDNLERILAHPLSMVCSDGGAFALQGPAHRGHPHPRGLGSFPRVLARYVRQRRILTLAQAIHKMSGFAALRLHLRDRGRLAAGAAADVVVFDPDSVSDQATFADPFQYPTGIGAVIVNGKVTIREGEHSATGAGRALRPA
jgi:N-acyl-D-amino-acid deacylase